MVSLHLWKKVGASLSCSIQNGRIWKMTCTTVAVSFSSGVESSDPVKAEKGKVESRQREKRKVFKKLKSLTVETIDLILREEEKNGVFVTQADLVTWAKRLEKNNDKPVNALEIFRWMDKKKMTFSPSELALYVDLIAKVKGYPAADAYFDKVDPTFNESDPDAKNWPAYTRLYHWQRAYEQKHGTMKRLVYVYPKWN